MPSPSVDASTARGAGTEPEPDARKPAAAGRISSWPYGSASGPETVTSVPRGGALAPSGRRTAIPPLASAIARSGGVPRRPASAITTPLTDTVVPTGRRRASAIDSEGVGWATVEGVAVGAGVGIGVAGGAGVGLGGRRRARRRGRRWARIRDHG